MTPRQLLSILRLSQALARLRMSHVVRQEDVDEALRLVQSSKSSLMEEDTQAAQSADYASAIFNMIRDCIANMPANSNQRKVIAYSALETMIIKKGYTTEQFKSCLEDYAKLGILHTHEDRTYIEMLCD